MDRQTKTLAACLGGAAAMGPMAMDMYLPAMPTMGQDLGALAGEIELSMVGFLIGFCLGQLLFGPISDATGRKPVMIVGVVLFVIASLGCLSATTIPQVIFWRVAQGIGGSVGMVMATASVRDLYTGHMATRLVGLTMIVFGVAPVIAPVAGGLILNYFSWHAVFWLLAGYGVLMLGALIKFFPETRSVESRANSRPSKALHTYWKLALDKDFIPYALANALSQSSLFVYIAGASFVLIEIYGLTPLQFSFAFAGNALALVVGAQLGGPLGQRLGPRRISKIATGLRATVTVLLLGVFLAGFATLPAVLVLLLVSLLIYGLALPTSGVLALDKQAQNAGTASALMGALGFGLGAIASGLLSTFSNGTALPLFALMAVTAVAAACVTWAFFDRWDQDAPVGASIAR